MRLIMIKKKITLAPVKTSLPETKINKTILGVHIL